MNKYPLITLIVSTLLAVSCGKGKEARALYDRAESLYENQQFIAVKNVIDTINRLYPAEINIRRKALTLMRRAERGECEWNIAFCDSLMPVREKEFEQMKKNFVFEKDTAYSETGRYIPPSMTVERNTERSYIRCGVTEEGEMYMASVYFGARPVEHTGLRLATPDGTYAQTPAIAYDGGLNYRFKDNGNTTEVVTYQGNSCRDIAGFAYINAKKRIRADYTGGKPFALYLSESDRKAVAATCELALALSEINAMKKEKNRSEMRIRMIDEKLK
jgi:hypothetical protein